MLNNNDLYNGYKKNFLWIATYYLESKKENTDEGNIIIAQLVRVNNIYLLPRNKQTNKNLHNFISEDPLTFLKTQKKMVGTWEGIIKREKNLNIVRQKNVTTHD